MTSITATGLTVGFTNILGTSATFLIEILNASNNVVATTTLTNQGSTVSYTFTGLVGGTAYNIRNTISLNGGTEVCALVPFTTESADVACANGMDVAFVIDYTFSMSGIIESVKAGAASLVNTIITQSGGNNYRLSLTTADENNASDGSTPNYAGCVDYTNLPAAQRITNAGANDFQFITAWEMFGTNNGTAFTTQLGKSNGGVNGTCVNLGDGGGTPEPTDYAAQLITGASAFTGAFRSNVAKYIIIITDKLPGGTQDQFNATVWAGIQQMIVDANTDGIKYFVCGPGVNESQVIAPVVNPIFPWKELAEQTSGSWNASADPSVISDEIIAGCS